MFKFTPRIQKTKKFSEGKKPTNKPVSFIRLPPLVPVKTLKKFNKISKYFKKITTKHWKRKMLRNYIHKPPHYLLARS